VRAGVYRRPVLADAERNHRAWFSRGRELTELDGAHVFVGRGSAILAFPDATGDLAGAVWLARDSGAKEVGCWALRPDDALGARLAELGFQDGWQPHWMGWDAHRRIEQPAYEIEETTACARDLPYASEAHELAIGGDVHHFVVRQETRIAGHVVLNVDGPTGGIYDMGVSAQFRRRGLARALTLAALERARREGCATVTLNATGEGEPVYRSAGFVSLGLGMTWWLFPTVRGPRDGGEAR
jgi:ribosomal protein S18 acetylase RimI-like enzyme